MSSMPPYAEAQFHPDEAPVMKRTSMLAVTSLVLAVVACCPIVGLLGPVLGVIALILIMLNPALKGGAIAVAAILIGLVLQGAVLFGLYRVAERVVEAPQAFVRAIEADDWDAARAASFGRAAAATDEEYAAFAEALDAQFGTISNWEPVGPPPGYQGNQQEPVFPFMFNVSTSQGGDATVTFEIVIVDEVSGDFPLRPRAITIEGADGTILEFPPPAPATAPTAVPAPGTDAAAPADGAGDSAPDPAGDPDGGGETP